MCIKGIHFYVPVQVVPVKLELVSVSNSEFGTLLSCINVHINTTDSLSKPSCTQYMNGTIQFGHCYLQHISDYKFFNYST